jgi:hypothetical protein
MLLPKYLQADVYRISAFECFLSCPVKWAVPLITNVYIGQFLRYLSGGAK